MQRVDLHCTIEINGESDESDDDEAAGAMLSVPAMSAEMCMPTGTVDKGSLKKKFKLVLFKVMFNNSGGKVSCK